jgi:hypothetical protein
MHPVYACMTVVDRGTGDAQASFDAVDRRRGLAAQHLGPWGRVIT